jgi:thiopurine S-methyltransferase
MMEAEFWHQRWETNQIAFHEKEANLQLVRNFQALSVAPNSRILVPLCGKTRDIGWLLAQGHSVVGAELSKLAVNQLFEGLGREPNVTPAGELLHYRAENVEVFVGDIFALSHEKIGTVDAVYDRAALVALPVGMRERYGAHLIEITNCAPQLLICFEYDQSVMPGPPFSVDRQELERVYGARYDMTQLASVGVHGGLKGICPAQEVVWLLR